MEKYTKGTIKVSWFDEQNNHILKSKMFTPEESEQAKALADTKKDSVTMILVSENGNEYEWELVKDKNTWKMDAGIYIFDNKIIMALILVLIVMGVIYSFKLIKGSI